MKNPPWVVGFAVDFGEWGLYYDPVYGRNWWSYFFEPISVGEKTNPQIVYPSDDQYQKAWRDRRYLPRAVAAELVRKYIRIKPHIQEKIDAFAAQFFPDRYVIGIHYRGTDKKSEAWRVGYRRVFEEVEKRISVDRPFSLFIATDEVQFLQAAQRLYPHQVIATDAHRASNKKGVHFTHRNNYDLGEEALIDAYLLSLCDILIRTSSNLSLWSTYFNPKLPVILLNCRKQSNTLEPE